MYTHTTAAVVVDTTVPSLRMGKRRGFRESQATVSLVSSFVPLCCWARTQFTQQPSFSPPRAPPLPYAPLDACLPHRPTTNDIIINQCLDVWILGHQSCPYCKGDLNILPPENNSATGSLVTTHIRSMLSSLAALATRPFALFREYRERWRRRRRQQHGEEGDDVDGNEDEGHNNSSAVEMTSPPSSTAATSSPAVLPMVSA